MEMRGDLAISQAPDETLEHPNFGRSEHREASIDLGALGSHPIHETRQELSIDQCLTRGDAEYTFHQLFGSIVFMEHPIGSRLDCRKDAILIILGGQNQRRHRMLLGGEGPTQIHPVPVGEREIQHNHMGPTRRDARTGLGESSRLPHHVHLIVTIDHTPQSGPYQHKRINQEKPDLPFDRANHLWNLP